VRIRRSALGTRASLFGAAALVHPDLQLGAYLGVGGDHARVS
jgi:hypothetical protein